MTAASRRRRGFEPQRFIAANLPILPLAGIPEIRLHRAQPTSGLWRLATMNRGGIGSPYWAYPWPGGLALARYILDRPETVAGRRVLDLGAGSGLVGIAAALAGAREVMAADVDRYAIAALTLNAAANEVTLTAVLADLTAGAPPRVDVVLVGDLFYERRLATRVATFLDRCLVSGQDVLIGDPGRAFLPLSRLRRLAECSAPDVGEGRKVLSTRGVVFSFGR